MALARPLWRVTCPHHASFHLLTAAKRESCGPRRKLVLLRTQWLVLCCKWEIRGSFLLNLLSRAWILFSESASRALVPQPLRRMEVTADLYSLNLLVMPLVLHRQILFSLVIPGAILIRISVEKLPYMCKVAPRYLKLVTSSNFQPSMLISAPTLHCSFLC